MKILILGNSCVGLYKFRKELLQRLVSENHDVYVSIPDGKFVPQIKEIGCKFLDTPIERRGKNPAKDFGLIRMYSFYLKEIKPDIVLTYTIKPNVYGGIACQKEKVPYVANVTGLGSAVENGGVLQLITTTLYRKGLKKAQKVFFQNEDNLEFMLKKKVVKNNYALIPGSGVNLEQHELSEYPKKNTIDFVYVGRMMTEKGFGLYLDAAEAIKSKYPETQFHVCGDYEDDYKERVEKLINDGIIIYHGMVEKMVDIYKNIHCTIHPTYYPEGMSNVLLESLACGRPIITTDRPGCKEIVDDGVNGFVVRQRDVVDLIEKIEKFLNLSHEERKRFGINGREKVEKLFDRNIVIDKYIEEINKAKK